MVLVILSTEREAYDGCPTIGVRFTMHAFPRLAGSPYACSGAVCVMGAIVRNARDRCEAIRKCLTENPLGAVACAHDTFAIGRFTENADAILAMETVDTGFARVFGRADDRRVLGEEKRTAAVDKGFQRSLGERRRHGGSLPDFTDQIARDENADFYTI